MRLDSWVLVSNPNAAEVTATVTLMTSTGAMTPFDVTVGASSRYTLHLNDYVEDDFNVSTQVAATGDIVVERALYWDSREREGIQPYKMMGGHSAVGVDP